MKKNPTKEETNELSNKIDLHDIIEKRYEDAIEYYWKASRTNKKWYKITRSLIIILGSLVTLVSSLSISNLLNDYSLVSSIFSFGTPVLAFLLTIIAGFSQTYQWGSTWQNMVLTAQYLQKEFDKYKVTSADARDYVAESEKLNNFVINETKGFFDRMLGVARFNDLNKT